MKITNAELKYPHDGDWWPTLAGGGKLLTKNSTPAQKADMFPYEVGPNINGGRLGEVGLTTLSVFDSGEGPAAVIEFELSAKPQKETDTATPIVVAKGVINISTGLWGSWKDIWKFKPFARPDDTIISYSIHDTTGKLIGTKNLPPNKNMQLQSPNDVDIAVAVDGNDGSIGFACTINNDNWKTAFDFALTGIFFAHKEAIGWVGGQVGLTVANGIILVENIFK